MIVIYFSVGDAKQGSIGLVQGRFLNLLLLYFTLLALYQFFRVYLKDVLTCGSKLDLEVILQPLVTRQHTQLS